MADYTFTVFDDDDSTLVFEVGTAADHDSPYLKQPGELDESQIDLAAGSASIGQINIVILDPQTGATKNDRFLTELLGSVAGYSALNGRRGLLKQVAPDEIVILDGVCWGVTLNASFAGFTLSLRDSAERGRKVSVFTRGGTSSVLPRGVLNGYGQLPSGAWLVPPVTPLVGYFDYFHPGTSGYFFPDHGIKKSGSSVSAGVVISAKAKAALAPQAVKDADAWKNIYSNVSVLWRAEGSADAWTELSNIDSAENDTYNNSGILCYTLPGKFKKSDGSQIDVTACSTIFMAAASGLPTPSQRIEVVVTYAGAPSDDYPWHFEGTWGELTRNILRGDYCTDDPKMRYDEAAILAVQIPARARITEPEDDLYKLLTKLCQPIGGALAYNNDGLLSPIRNELPTVDVDLPVIDETNTTPEAGWDHPADNAITSVSISYKRDSYVAVEVDGGASDAAGDGIVERDVTITHRAQQDAIDRMGDKPLEIDAFFFRALGGDDGSPISGEITDETGAQFAEARAHQTIDRFVYGGQLSSASVDTDAVPGILAGGWLIDRRPWAPDYVTGQRGRNALAQVVSAKRTSEKKILLQLVDAAPYDNPIEQPTLGSISVDSSNVLSVPIAALPAGGGDARVDFSFSVTDPTEPDENSPLWTFLGRKGELVTLQSQPLPAGSSIWVRARGEANGRRPSAWTDAVNVSAASAPSLVRATVSVNEDSGEATVEWTPSSTTLGLKLYYSIHRQGEDPDFELPLSVDAALGAFDLGVMVDPAMQITVDFEPWSGWTGTAVSGSAGTRVRREATRTDADGLSRSFRSFHEISRDTDAGTITYEGVLGPDVDTVWIYEVLQNNPPTSDPWPGADSTPTQGPFVRDGDTVQVTFNLPAQDQLRYVLAIPHDASGVPGHVQYLVIPPYMDAPDKLIAIQVLVFDNDGSANVRIDAVEKTASIRYAIEVFDRDTGAAGPADSDVEAGTFHTISGSYTFPLSAGTVDYNQGLRVRACGYINADGTGRNDLATEHGDIIGAQDVREKPPVTLEVTKEDKPDAVTARYGVTPHDAGGYATALYYRTQVDAGDPGPWTLKSASPTNLVEYLQTATLVERHNIYIEYRLDGVYNGSEFHIPLKSNGFDKGKIPNITIVADIAQNGDSSASLGGDVDTNSFKVAASTSGIPSDATVRAATAINGRNLTPADVGVLLNATVGQIVYYKAFGYSATGGGGLESSSSSITQKMRTAANIPKYDWKVVRTGSTASLTGVISDFLLKVTAIQWRTRIGDGTLGSFSSSWTSSTGTIGSSTTLSRAENFTVSPGKDSDVTWQITYTDENGNSQTLAGTIPLGNLDSATKHAFIPSQKFIPGENSYVWNIGASGTLGGVAAGDNSFFFAAVEIDQGNTMTGISVPMSRSSTSDIAEVKLIRVSDGHVLATLTHTGTGSSTVTASVSELVAGHYTLRFQSFANANADVASLDDGADITYTIPNLVNS